MRKLFYLLVVLVFLSSCEKEELENWLDSKNSPYTIPELYDAIGLSQYGCTDTLACEGKYAIVTGYITKTNVFPNESRFLLFSEKDDHISVVFNQMVVNVKVNDNNSTRIFSIIENSYSDFPDDTWRKVQIKAEIYGWTIYGNGWCEKSVGLIGHDIDILE